MAETVFATFAVPLRPDFKPHNSPIIEVMKKRNTYTRVVSANSYGTVCLPSPAIPDTNVEAFRLVGYDKEAQILYFDPIKHLEAGHAYLFKSHSRRACFLRDGEEDVCRPIKGEQMAGTFNVSLPIGPNAMVLVGDEWVLAPRDIYLDAFSAWLILMVRPISNHHGQIAMHINMEKRL